MLFLQFVLYLSSFVGTLKKWDTGAALELWKLKIQQFSPGILKFGTKNKDNPLTLNFLKVSCTFSFIFHAGSQGLGSKNFRNSSYKEKTASSACVSRLSFCFLWLWLDREDHWKETLQTSYPYGLNESKRKTDPNFPVGDSFPPIPRSRKKTFCQMYRWFQFCQRSRHRIHI